MSTGTAAKARANAKAYLNQPYHREMVRNEDGTFFARVIEFPGCMTEGDTEAEVLANLNDAMIAWIEAKLEDKEEIPKPIEDENYSGKFLVRVPKTIHKELARRAEIEGVSLNQYVLTGLACMVGRERMDLK
jgi:antitoxin HicB